MALPADFDKDLWLDPLTFQGLIGAVIADSRADYRSLFRASDNFAKPIAELVKDPAILRIMRNLGVRNLP